MNARVVELREARAAGHTGSLVIYNFLASQLPQDTTMFFQRFTFLAMTDQNVNVDFSSGSRMHLCVTTLLLGDHGYVMVHLW